jgi:hypothetical protein
MFKVICRTEGCRSFGRISSLPEIDSVVFCGWCSQEITDVTEIVVEPIIDSEPIV